MQFVPVQAELLRQQKSFRHADHVDGQHHVVADLHRLAGAGPAGVEDILAHRLQDRLAAGEGVLGAADHERQRAVLRADRAARNRRVQHRQTGRLGRRGDGARAFHIDGGTIDQQRFGALHRLDQAALVQPDVPHMLAGGQHGDDEIGALSRPRRRWWRSCRRRRPAPATQPALRS